MQGPYLELQKERHFQAISADNEAISIRKHSMTRQPILDEDNEVSHMMMWTSNNHGAEVVVSSYNLVTIDVTS